MNEYKIKKEDEGIRLDKVISKLEQDISRSSIQRMIEEGSILVNANKVKVSYKVTEGDCLTIQEEQLKETNLLPQDIPLDIIYEDEDILLVNKQKGMVVHPGARKSRWNTCECNNGQV